MTCAQQKVLILQHMQGDFEETFLPSLKWNISQLVKDVFLFLYLNWDIVFHNKDMKVRKKNLIHLPYLSFLLLVC